METTGNSLSNLESALHRLDSQKRMAVELSLSEGELSKTLAGLRKAVPVIEYLGLALVDAEIHTALRRLLKEAL